MALDAASALDLSSSDGLATWSRSSDEIARVFQVDLKSGIEDREAQRRITRFGPDTLSEERKTSGFVKFVQQFKSPVVIALLIATIVSIPGAKGASATESRTFPGAAEID